MALAVIAGPLAAQVCGVPADVIFVDGFRDLPFSPPVAPPPAITLPAESTPLAVQIVAPIGGLVTSRSEVEILGTFAGPPNTGLRINDSTPLIHGNQFVLPALALPLGQSTIEARVVAMTGAAQVASISVTVDPGTSPDPLVFNADRAGGFAPTAVAFSWQSPLTDGFDRIQVDYDDDGVFEVDSTDVATPLRYVYRVPGVHLARLRLTTAAPGSVIHEATRTIVALNSNYTRATLCYVFERLRSRLSAADVNGALGTLHPDLQPTFNAFWMANTAQLPAMAGQLGIIADGTLGLDTAQLMITRAVGGQAEPNAFFVNFETDLDGIWRISGM